MPLSTRPFFRTADAPAQTKRLLLLSYHFPPAQAVGALRWQKFARFIAERGWGLDVITLHPSDLKSKDPSRLAELPEGMRVLGVPRSSPLIERIEHEVWTIYRKLSPRRVGVATEAAENAQAPFPKAERRPGSLGHAEMHWARHVPRDFVRTYYAWLEYARTGAWAHDAAELAMRVADPRVHLAIVSCGPPHMVHDAGRRVARRVGRPFIMDMRDPWRLVQRLPEEVASPLWMRLAARHERDAVRDATLVVANTAPLRAAMQARYPDAADRIITVMNGYDDERLPRTRRDARFTLLYAGTIYLDRDPRLLFRAAARVIRELALTPAQFGMEFIGAADTYAGAEIVGMAAQEGIREFVRSRPPMSRAMAMQELAGATMLVSLPQDSDMAIPSKVFEYMRFEAWVLALTTPQSATAGVLGVTGADVCAPDDVDGIAAVLARRYRQFAAGEMPPRLAQDERFSRRTQARILLDAIDTCCARFEPQPVDGRATGDGTREAGGSSDT
ncbi:MAG: hypothetical protein M3081_06250 [Gemmatimonadota bacterium]|nr:hypothetical protein [Gemmatimonadota bacterium]